MRGVAQCQYALEATQLDGRLQRIVGDPHRPHMNDSSITVPGRFERSTFTQSREAPLALFSLAWNSTRTPLSNHFSRIRLASSSLHCRKSLSTSPTQRLELPLLVRP